MTNVFSFHCKAMNILFAVHYKVLMIDHDLLLLQINKCHVHCEAKNITFIAKQWTLCLSLIDNDVSVGKWQALCLSQVAKCCFHFKAMSIVVIAKWKIMTSVAFVAKQQTSIKSDEHFFIAKWQAQWSFKCNYCCHCKATFTMFVTLW